MDIARITQIYPIAPYEAKSFLQALTHTSWANEAGDRSLANERLEFYGDAILGLIISEYLFAKYPDFPEGILTRLKSELVREPILAEVARELGISEMLLVGGGARNEDQQHRPSVQADAVEAIIGWIAANRCLAEAKVWVLAHWQRFLDSIEPDLNTDFKGLLQEKVYKQFALVPEYHQVAETGPPHDRRFRVAVMFADRPWGAGEGRTKKEAEQKAAKESLRLLSLTDVD